MLGGGLSCGGSSGTGTSRLLLLILGGLVAGSLGNGLSILLILVDGPIKDVVILESLADKEITEDLTEIRVVRLVIKAERACVVQVDGELIREATAKNLSRSGHLLLHDAVILLLLGSSLQALPWEGTAAEIEHDVSKGFHIITAGLLCITVSACEFSRLRETYRRPNEY